jgi:hypothetical protein
MFNHKGKGLINHPGINEMVVVEDKDETLGNGSDLVKQCR